MPRIAYAEATGYTMRNGMAHANCLTTASPVGDANLAAELAALNITDDPSINPELKRLVLERIATNEAVEAKLAEWAAPASVYEDPATIWARKNPAQPEAVAHLAELANRERIRRARQPKRFLIRRAGPGLWAVRDQAKPHWVGSRMTHAGIIDMLDVLGRHPEHLGAWDGRVRFTVRRPELELEDDYDDWND